MTTSVTTRTALTTRFPAGAPTSVADLLNQLATAPEKPLRVGDPRMVDFLSALSRHLLTPALARRFPELGSLGYFLRRSEIVRAAQRMSERADGALAFPRGLVFHLPPANVDTIFVYSWALAALAGNANIVRISARSAGAAEAVLDALNATLADADPVIAQTQRMVTYGHDDEVTAALSAACDLRVIWGGDRAVNEIRRHPLAPSARDLTFPDRSSFAVISVAGWQAASAEQRRAAVVGFTNDAYWFDQAACASPRAVFLVGGEQPAVAVKDEFLALLAEVVEERAWTVDAAMAVEKRVAAYGLAAEGDADRVAFRGNAVAVLDLVSAESLPRRWLGAGTFPMATVATLADLLPLIARKDQTLSQFGFSRDELTDFLSDLGGRGIDRVVPFGDALSFSSVWDGYELPREFTRLTTL